MVNFGAGGIGTTLECISISDYTATPADCALMMELGMDGVFVGSAIFESSHPEEYASVRSTRVLDTPLTVGNGHCHHLLFQSIDGLTSVLPERDTDGSFLNRSIATVTIGWNIDDRHEYL